MENAEVSSETPPQVTREVIIRQAVHDAETQPHMALDRLTVTGGGYAASLPRHLWDVLAQEYRLDDARPIPPAPSGGFDVNIGPEAKDRTP